ncbi:MAG: GGDEF domain-containing protein [Leptospiraceae bacterium]|nr:GGDEF domain-containing protein [Leptospiraceae bacterium]
MKNFLKLIFYKKTDVIFPTQKSTSNSIKIKYLVFVASLILVVLLGIIDYLIGYEISFSIFYLIPISLSVFYSGFRLSIIVSILSAIIWFLADKESGHIYNNLLIPFWNAIMRFGYFFLHSLFLERFINLYIKVLNDSMTDSLTGCKNSRFFYKLFEMELNKAKRTLRPYTVVYIDLDNFKLMNDTYGHLEGDSLLKLISEKVKLHIRPSDVFARLGGDEFALLFPESDHNQSNKLITRLRTLVIEEIVKRNWPVTLSIGAITFKTNKYSINEMMKLADDLMYKVKNNGKNNIEHILEE